MRNVGGSSAAGTPAGRGGVPRNICGAVPLYDFRCQRCEERFEALAGVSAGAACPSCGSEEVERVYSAFAGPFTVGLRGQAAKRSNATRAVREEQRRERKEARRQQREGS